MTIGVIDTGVDKNNTAIAQADIQGIALFRNEDGSITREPGALNDERGHGTSIISTICLHSILPKFHVVKVASHNDYITEDLLEEAIVYLLNNTDAVVINISMGIRTDVPSAALVRICNEAYERGVTIVAASHPMVNQSCFPAHLRGVIGVGEATTSNMNSFYYLEDAPTNIFTKSDFKNLALPNQQFDDCKGTSFATANFTGIIAAAYLNNEWDSNLTLKKWLAKNAVNQVVRRCLTDNIDALLERCKQISREDGTTISKQYFNEQYGYPSIPVLFTNEFQHWQQKYSISPEQFATLLPHKEIVASSDDAVKGIELSLAEYLRQQEDGLFYYKTNKLLPEILGYDFQVPDLFNCWYKSTASGRPSRNLSWLYVGAGGTYTGLHTDIWNTDAWNYLFSGRKLWMIFPKVYNDYIRGHMDRFRTNDLPTFINNMLVEDCRPMVCVQEPGQMFYIPGHYYHAVFNLDLTISVTGNFINEINYDYVRSHFRGGSNSKNLKAIESMIREGFSKLENTHKK
jgi:hypothetical protein